MKLLSIGTSRGFLACVLNRNINYSVHLITILNFVILILFNDSEEVLFLQIFYLS